MTDTNLRPRLEYDLFAEAVQEDPYPIYEQLLAQGPVYHNQGRNFYALARFDDVDAALRDWQHFSSAAGVRPDDLLELQGPSIIAMTPPRHRELRQAVQAPFLAQAVAGLEAMVEAKALHLLADLEGAEEIEVVEPFVKRLPVLVICALLGLPESDAGTLKGLADELTAASAADGTSAAARPAAQQLHDYFAAQLEDRRRHPGGDLISRLAAAGTAAGPVAEDEAIGMCNLLFEAGNATTSSLIANSLVALADFPDQRSWVIDHPEAWPGAIEELLRFDAPVQNMSRLTSEPISLHGADLPEGALVVLVLGAADRDPRRWEAPNRLDLGRPPQRNVAFGAGLHHCIGAPLARLEGRVALRLLLSRIPGYTVVRAERAHDINLHMYKSLVLRPGKWQRGNKER